MDNAKGMIESKRRLSHRSTEVQESATLAVAAEAKRLRSEGISVVSLSTGEPDFPTPDVIKQAAIGAIEGNFTYYTQSEGIPELRRAIAEKFTSENAIPTSPSQVLVSSGGKHSIFNALMAICDIGDEVLIPAPYWVSYPEMVRLIGATPVVMKTRASDRYKITPDQIRSMTTPNTRAIIVNSPSNPTGVMYTPEELRAIGETVAELGIYVISDELYEKIVYDGREHFSVGSMPELRDLAITVNGVSKAYSMTGWRIGYMCGPGDVIEAAARIQSQVTSNPNSIGQKAALAALTSAGDDVRRMTAIFERRRDMVSELLRAIPRVSFPRPDGAFYIFLDVSSYYSSSMPDGASLASHLLREEHVATVPGSAFGDDDTIRLSYACSEENIQEGVARIARGLKSLE